MMYSSLSITVTWLVVFIAIPVYSATITVPGDYPTIQEAVDASADGDIVRISNGFYPEHVVIMKSISVIGENAKSTIIDGGRTGSVLFIEATNAILEKLTVQYSGNLFEDAGITVSYSYQCVITNCEIHDNKSGIDLYGSGNNKISCNNIYTNDNGIQFSESTLGPSTNNMRNIIEYNTIDSNTNSGITFEHTGAAYHHSGTVSHNTISRNSHGISMIMSEQNEICFNEISNNIFYGISLAMCMGGGDGNIIHHNNFLYNNSGSTQAADGGGGTNFWYSSSLKEGNYWSDYTGPDLDMNGIGDVPYDINYMAAQDIYPLMDPYFIKVPFISLSLAVILWFILSLCIWRQFSRILSR